MKKWLPKQPLKLTLGENHRLNSRTAQSHDELKVHAMKFFMQ
jgi:hypothetical protein